MSELELSEARFFNKTFYFEIILDSHTIVINLMCLSPGLPNDNIMQNYNIISEPEK